MRVGGWDAAFRVGARGLLLLLRLGPLLCGCTHLTRQEIRTGQPIFRLIFRKQVDCVRHRAQKVTQSIVRASRFNDYKFSFCHVTV